MKKNMTDEEKIQWEVYQVKQMPNKQELARKYALAFIATHWPVEWRQQE